MPEIMVEAADGGSFKAYMALPERLPAPAVLLLQEVYGVNRFMKRITDYWAGQGFLAVCPDVYWRLRPGIVLDPETPGHRDEAIAIGHTLDTDRAVADMMTLVEHVRQMSECSGKVGTSGYCLGGKLAFLIGTRGEADCNVSYYGVGIEAYLDEAPRLSRPLLMHIGGADPWTPPAVCRQFDEVLGPNPLVTMHTYADTDHAFAREGAATDVPAMRELANGRTLAFFRENLS